MRRFERRESAQSWSLDIAATCVRGASRETSHSDLRCAFLSACGANLTHTSRILHEQDRSTTIIYIPDPAPPPSLAFLASPCAYLRHSTYHPYSEFRRRYLFPFASIAVIIYPYPRFVTKLEDCTLLCFSLHIFIIQGHGCEQEKLNGLEWKWNETNACAYGSILLHE